MLLHITGSPDIGSLVDVVGDLDTEAEAFMDMVRHRTATRHHRHHNNSLGSSNASNSQSGLGNNQPTETPSGQQTVSTREIIEGSASNTSGTGQGPFTVDTPMEVDQLGVYASFFIIQPAYHTIDIVSSNALTNTGPVL